MPLQGSYTAAHTSAAYASSYWVLDNWNCNNKDETAEFEVAGYENLAA